MSCSGLARLNIVTSSTKFNEVPIKIPMGVVIELERLILKFMWRNKCLKITKTFLKKKEEEERCLQYT